MLDERVIWATWAVVLLAPVLVIAVALLLAAHRRSRTSHRLDRLWGWLGEGVGPLTSGREWTGRVDGREVQVDWFNDTTEVHVQAKPRVRIGFAREDDPSTGAPEEGRPYPIEDGEIAWTEAPGEVPAVVSQPGVREALRTLLADDGRSLRAIEVDPEEGVGWLARHLPERRFDRRDTERWVRALVDLAEATEAVPA